MKFIFRVVVVLALGFLLPAFPAWWMKIPVWVLVGFVLYGNNLNLFNAGFLGGGIVWLLLSFQLDYQNSGILSGRISETIQGFEADTMYFIVLAGLIGALTTGLGMLTGSSLRNLVRKGPRKGNPLGFREYNS